MDPDVTEAELAAHLSDESTSKLLETVGIYVCAYELVSTTVIANVSGFFTAGFDAAGTEVFDSDWDTVRATDRHELAACLRWLVDQGVITDAQAAGVDELRQARNRFAHEFTEILTNPRGDIDMGLLVNARNILKNTAVFFGSIDADLAADEGPGADGPVDYDGIESGASLLFAHALRVWAGLTVEQVEAAWAAPGADGT